MRVFHQALQRCWIKELIDSPNIDLLVGVPPEELLPHLTRLFGAADALQGTRSARSQSPEIIADPFVYPADKKGPHEVVHKIAEMVTEAARQGFLAMGCAADSYTRWEQVFKNWKNIPLLPPVEPLFDQFKDMTAIVLGAGPSMEEFIKECHENQVHKKALVIACDASLRRLLKEDIRPHIVIRCERKFTEIFDEVTKDKTQDIYYVAYPWTDPRYFDLFEKRLLAYRDNGVCRWTDYDPGCINGGVSAANACMEAAIVLGCKRIILNGIDCVFVNDKSHMDGTTVEFDIQKSKSKWSKLATNDGKEATTIPVWKRTHGEYAGQIFKHELKGKKIEYVNTSLKGAVIGGAPYKPWSDLKDWLSEEVDPVSRLSTLIKEPEAGVADKLNKTKEETHHFLKRFKKGLSKLFREVDDAMAIATREEHKIMLQMRSYSHPVDFFVDRQRMMQNLIKPYQGPCQLIDSFKKKWYAEELFMQLFLDTCQLDHFQIENKIAALRNKVEVEHERLRYYTSYHMGIFRTFEFYLDKFLDMFENGVNQTPDYSLGEEDKKIMAEMKMLEAKARRLGIE